jgi:hypothetical protein
MATGIVGYGSRRFDDLFLPAWLGLIVATVFHIFAAPDDLARSPTGLVHSPRHGFFPLILFLLKFYLDFCVIMI